MKRGSDPATRIAAAYACQTTSCACYRVGDNGQRVTHCPCHDDRLPSLSVGPGDRVPVVVHCQAGCEQENVIERLKVDGLWPGGGRQPEADPAPSWPDDRDPWAFFEDRSLPRDFVESMGIRIVQLPGLGVGFQFAFESQTVVKNRPLSGVAKYFWSPRDVPVPPFWPVPTTTEDDKEAIICAGETDCLALRYAGFDNAFAVTRGERNVPSGAAWRALQALGYESVILLFDLDDAGRRGSAQAAQLAQAEGFNARIATLPASLALGGGKDVSDLLTLEKGNPKRLRKVVSNVLAEAVGAIREMPVAVPGEPNLTEEHLENLGEVTLGEEGEVRQLLEVNAATLQTGETSDEEETELRSLPVVGEENVFINGWSHVLGSYSRVGKTELLRHLAGEWPEEQIVWFTEESKRLWRQRLKRTPSPLLSNVTLVFAQASAPRDLLSRMAVGDATLVIIDTMRNLLGFVSENDNSEVARVLKPFVTMSHRQGQTLILTHHDRKTSGEYGRALAGASAFLGAVDIYIQLSRVRGKLRQRAISGVARLIDVPEFTFEMGDGGLMTYLGELRGVEVATVRENLLDIIRASGVKDWLPVMEIAALFTEQRPSRTHLTRALNKETELGYLERTPPLSESAVGRTCRWRLSAQGIAAGEPTPMEEMA